VVIVAFMWRYLHVLGEQVSNMQTARAARGYSARFFWQAAASTGSLVATMFVRSLGTRGARLPRHAQPRLHRDHAGGGHRAFRAAPGRRIVPGPLAALLVLVRVLLP
jgi:hypothetical protein